VSAPTNSVACCEPRLTSAPKAASGVGSEGRFRRRCSRLGAQPPRSVITVSGRHSRIKAIVFDVGETLVDETRAWSHEAKRAGVTPLTLFAALGALIERGKDHREVWALLGVEPPTRPLTSRAVRLLPGRSPMLAQCGSRRIASRYRWKSTPRCRGGAAEARRPHISRSFLQPLGCREAVTRLLPTNLRRYGCRAGQRRLRR